MSDENKDDILDIIPLDKNTAKLANQIINETDLDNVKNLTHLFNLNQTKKNVLRIIKLNQLLDHVSDEMIERFSKRAGEFNNSDLLNYFTVVQNSIDRANKSIQLIDDEQPITVNQVNLNITNNNDGLDSDSRARITEAVSKILQLANEKHIEIPEEDIIITSDDTEQKDQPTVYNKLNEEE